MQRHLVHIHGWLLLLPAAVMLAAFTHYPAVRTFIDSIFSTPRGRRPAQFIGLDHYRHMLVVRPQRKIPFMDVLTY